MSIAIVTEENNIYFVGTGCSIYEENGDIKISGLTDSDIIINIPFDGDSEITMLVLDELIDEITIGAKVFNIHSRMREIMCVREARIREAEKG